MGDFRGFLRIRIIRTLKTKKNRLINVSNLKNTKYKIQNGLKKFYDY